MNLSEDAPFINGNHDTFSVNLKTGLFICFSAKCGAKGHIKKIVGDTDDEFNYEEVANIQLSDFEVAEKNTAEYLKPQVEELTKWQLIHDYMLARGFDKKFLQDNLIGYNKEAHCVTIPITLEGEYYGSINRTVIKEYIPKYSYPNGLPKKDIVYKPVKIIDKDKPNRLLLVEGSIDALKSAQYGYNSMAFLGCDISYEQVEIIKRFAAENNLRITMLFDNDESGYVGLNKALSKHYMLDCDVALIADLQPLDNSGSICYYKDMEKCEVKKDVCDLTEFELDTVLVQAKDRTNYEFMF